MVRTGANVAKCGDIVDTVDIIKEKARSWVSVP